MSYPEHVKEAARLLDPLCWRSYSGQPRGTKQIADSRRAKALHTATELDGRTVEQLQNILECVHGAHYLDAVRRILDHKRSVEAVTPPPKKSIYRHTPEELDQAVAYAQQEIGEERFFTILHGIDAYMERRRRLLLSRDKVFREDENEDDNWGDFR